MIEKLYRVLDDFYKINPIPLKKLSKKVLELSNYFNSIKKDNFLYGDDEDYSLAYLYYFYPLNVCKYLTLLSYFKNEMGDCRVFLDVGSGPLTFYTALSLVNYPMDRLFAIDKSKKFMELGKKVLEKIDNSISQKIVYGLPDKNVDLINFGNVFAEIDDEKTTQFLDSYIKYLSEKNAYIMIVEPGTKRSFKNLLHIKDYLLEQGFCLINDCPTQNCWRRDDWCHENIFFPRSELIVNIENQNKLNNKFVNFTYLIMKKGEKLIKSQDFTRVISNLIEHKGLYQIDVCTKDGILKYELLKRDISNNNSDFLKIRRGDIIKIEGESVKTGYRRINKESRVEIIKKWQVL